jgi:hypothetical protein
LVTPQEGAVSSRSVDKSLYDKLPEIRQGSLDKVFPITIVAKRGATK